MLAHSGITHSGLSTPTPSRPDCAITGKYRRHGNDVEIVGMNDASTQMRQRLAGKLGG